MDAKLDQFDLTGKTALVTGAARGIGASCVEALASAGAKVLVTDIDINLAHAVAENCRSSGAEAIAIQHNVCDEAQWQMAIKEALRQFGGLDIVVNNAGIESMSLVEETTLEDWQRVMNVNADGVFLGTKHAIQAMKPGGAAGQGGSIVNIASMCSMIALEGSGSYSAAKAAVAQLTKVSAVECGRKGYKIRINSVHPGVILTDLVKKGMQRSANEGIFSSPEEAHAVYESQHPIGHLGQPEDVANAVVYLASNASQFSTGSQIVVDGGYTAL